MMIGLFNSWAAFIKRQKVRPRPRQGHFVRPKQHHNVRDTQFMQLNMVVRKLCVRDADTLFHD